mmetsp:Transcript_566/g.1762  ORF Transcript_566/g.1762 Transcript_566/m.1762 type:complete len:449 (-) Transcript_566:349-1695(-)
MDGRVVAGRILQSDASPLDHRARALCIVNVAPERNVHLVLHEERLEVAERILRQLRVASVHLPVAGDDHPRRARAVDGREVGSDERVLPRAFRRAHLRVQHQHVQRALLEAVPAIVRRADGLGSTHRARHADDHRRVVSAAGLLADVLLADARPGIWLGARWHVEACLCRHTAFAAGVARANRVAAAGEVALVVAHAGHVGHVGRDRLNLSHEAIPLGLVARGVRQIARVQHEVDALAAVAREALRNVHCRVDSVWLLPVVLRAVLISFTHVCGDYHRESAVRVNGRRRRERVHGRPAVSVRADAVEELGRRRARRVARELEHRLVEESRSMEAGRIRREAAQVGRGVGVARGGRDTIERGRLDAPLDAMLRSVVALRRRPRHAHLLHGGGAREPQVHWGRRIAQRDGVRDSEDLKVARVGERAREEHPVDRRAHVGHDEVVVPAIQL